MQISTARWPASAYLLVEAAVVDDFTAVDWIDGLHHVVSYRIRWPAVVLNLQPSMQAAAGTLSGQIAMVMVP